MGAISAFKPRNHEGSAGCSDHPKDDRRAYLVNAYRVLLTRARQGTVIVVPPGDDDDHTRKTEFYNPVYRFLCKLGIEELSCTS